MDLNNCVLKIVKNITGVIKRQSNWLLTIGEDIPFPKMYHSKYRSVYSIEVFYW